MNQAVTKVSNGSRKSAQAVYFLGEGNTLDIVTGIVRAGITARRGRMVLVSQKIQAGRLQSTMLRGRQPEGQKDNSNDVA